MRPLPAPIDPVAVRAYSATCAYGCGVEALARGIASNRSALRGNDLPGIALATAIGRVEGLEALAWDDAAWDSRATRLAWRSLLADGVAAAVGAAVQRHGAPRVGLVLGTSASTIAVSEQAYRQGAGDGGFPLPLRHEALNTPHAPADFIRRRLGLQGLALTVSTACSSGAQAIAVAERWLRLGMADAVLAGGLDVLGASLLHGFAALQVLSEPPCRPFDAARRGISIGEAAAWLLLERGRGALELRGHGVASDAHHMSSPHPQGLGAEAALDDALARAAIDAEALDLVHLHGTGTLANDAVEAALTARRYRADVHACATKGLTGHTMGAAGALGAVITLAALERGLRPGSAPTVVPDPALGAGFAARWRPAPVRRRLSSAASHAFGFGGHNVVLVFAAC